VLGKDLAYKKVRKFMPNKFYDIDPYLNTGAIMLNNGKNSQFLPLGANVIKQIPQ
jgi:hypothetical protein